MNQNETLRKYPELFGTDFSPQKTLMGFGFEVGKGWAGVIQKHLPEISKVVEEQKLTDFRIVQVKEKFGMLSIYCNYYIDEIDEIIDEMEEECSKTCEKCGSTENVEYRQDGWMRVTCSRCEEEKVKGKL